MFNIATRGGKHSRAPAPHVGRLGSTSNVLVNKLQAKLNPVRILTQDKRARGGLMNASLSLSQILNWLYRFDCLSNILLMVPDFQSKFIGFKNSTPWKIEAESEPYWYRGA